ncbi:MAG TPA: N-formylglutamate deformylase [Dongiaceae bacterium]|jgi:N-formylglutamate deformylase
MDLYKFTPGAAPLLVSMPHIGTHVPADIAGRMTNSALTLPDTDWNLDRLYDFLGALGAATIQATHSRYVIDLNRAPDGKALYPGASNTELCPTTQFDDSPIYRPGQAPGEAEIQSRRDAYWRPYHERLVAELKAIKAQHGYALLFDAHSIKSVVPRFFEGRLPDLNLGTGDGSSAAAGLAARLIEAAGEAIDYTSVLNGRFKGGYITRNYGRPAERVHAVQLELAEITYMDEDPPFGFRDDLAARLRPHLRALLEAMLAWGRESAVPE